MFTVITVSKLMRKFPELYTHTYIKVKMKKVSQHVTRVARYNTEHLVKYESHINNEQIFSTISKNIA